MIEREFFFSDNKKKVGITSKIGSVAEKSVIEKNKQSRGDRVEKQRNN